VKFGDIFKLSFCCSFVPDGLVIFMCNSYFNYLNTVSPRNFLENFWGQTWEFDKTRYPSGSVNRQLRFTYIPGTYQVRPHLNADE